MKLVISGILDGSKSKSLFSLIFAHGGGQLNLPDRDPVFRHHGIHLILHFSKPDILSLAI
jgi:hypothetical protein